MVGFFKNNRVPLHLGDVFDILRRNVVGRQNNPILKKRIAVPIVAYVMNRGQVQCKTGNRETFINGLAPLVKQGSGHNKQQPVFALIPKLADDQQGFIRFTQRTLVTQNNAFQIR